MDAENTAHQTVTAALEAAAAWKAEAEAQHEAEKGRVEQEIRGLRQTIANLESQVKALETHRNEVEAQGAEIDGGHVLRGYNGVFVALHHQAKKLANRSEELAEAVLSRKQALADALRSSEVAPVLKEVEQFQETVAPTLDKLPPSYRTAILSHHEAQKKSLDEYIGKLNLPAARTQGDELSVEIVWSVDVPEGEPGIVMAVLPVSEEVQANWYERDDDLQLWLTARVVQAVYTAFAGTANAASPAMFGGHQGLLAIEVELVTTDAEALRAALQHALSNTLGDAPELVDGQLVAEARFVDVDMLLPPEELDEGDADTEVHDAAKEGNHAG